MAQWIVLTAHGRWVVGSNPIRVIGGVRKGIRPQMLLCSKDKSVPRPAQKKAQFRVSHRVMVTLNGQKFYVEFLDISLERVI